MGEPYSSSGHNGNQWSINKVHIWTDLITIVENSRSVLNKKVSLICHYDEQLTNMFSEEWRIFFGKIVDAGKFTQLVSIMRKQTRDQRSAWIQHEYCHPLSPRRRNLSWISWWRSCLISQLCNSFNYQWQYWQHGFVLPPLKWMIEDFPSAIIAIKKNNYGHYGYGHYGNYSVPCNDVQGL